MLLVPDPIDAHATRRRMIRGLAVAATLAGSLTGGKLIGRAFEPSHPMLSDRDLTSVSQPSRSTAVVSPEESRNPSLPWLLGRTNRTASSRSEHQRPRPRPVQPGPRLRVDDVQHFRPTRRIPPSRIRLQRTPMALAEAAG